MKTNSKFNARLFFPTANIRFASVAALLLVAMMSPENPSTSAPTQSANVEAQSISRCDIRNQTFKAGETITYKLYYTLSFVWVAAGEVTFSVSEEGSKYRLIADGKTYPAFDPFFKVRDNYNCLVDKNTLLPYQSIRQIREGGYRLYDKVIFDQQSGKATSYRGKSQDKTKRTVYDIENCMHDVLSIIYFTRNLDFNRFREGDDVPVKIFMDKETWPLEVTYLGKEEDMKVKGQGRFNTIKFRPDVISGQVFKEGTEMNVWVSDDKNRMPLVIESPLSVGKMKAVVKEYKGLKYDLDAKVK